MTATVISAKKASATAPMTVAASNAYWSQPTADVLTQSDSSPNGLSQADAARKLAQVGHNVLATQSQVTPLGLFLNPLPLHGSVHSVALPERPVQGVMCSTANACCKIGVNR